MKRGRPLQRRTPLRQGSGFKSKPQALKASGPAKTVEKLKRCKAPGCSNRFLPGRPFDDWCCPECAVALAAHRVAKRKAAEVKREAREHREKLADVKPLAHWLKLTQAVVNAYVLLRDADRPCISCGCIEAFAWDAGHYLSRGARPELRFDLDNIAKQCAACNRHRGGNQANYRLGLVERIGLDRIERLEGPNAPLKANREGLAEIRRAVSALIRSLKRAAS